MRRQFGDIALAFNLPSQVLTSNGPMSCRKALVLAYTTCLVWEVALVECLVFTGLVWVVMTRYYHCVHGILCFSQDCCGVALKDDCSHMGGSDDLESLVSWWWYPCWMCVDSIFVLGCIHYTFRGIFYIVI